MAGLLDSAALMDPTPKAGSRIKVPKSAAKPKEVKRGLLAPLEDFLDGGQARRKWLNDKAGAVTQFIPPELRPWVGAADMMNPISDIGRAGQASTRMVAPDATPNERFGAGVDMVTDMASVLAPAIGMKLAGQGGAKALQEALVGVSSSADDAAGEAADAWRRFAADESGAVKVWHGDSKPPVPKGSDIRFEREMRGYSGGQSDITTRIFDGDSPVGRVDYSVYAGQPNLQMVEIDPAHRRKGYATEALRDLQRQYPDQEINWGSLTSDGAKLRDKTRFKEVPTKYKGAFDEIENLTSEMGGLEKVIADRWGTPEANSAMERFYSLEAQADQLRRKVEGQKPNISLIDDAPPTKAQEVAEMLAQGRGGEVTDGLLTQADPSELWRLYEGGKTGQAMPMDEASRMARAEGMGFDTGTPLYHGTMKDFPEFSKNEAAGVELNFGENQYNLGHFATNDPKYAGQYAVPAYNGQDGGPNIIPIQQRANLARRDSDLIDEIETYWSGDQSAEFVGDLREKGFGGVDFGAVRYNGQKPITEVSIFDPSNIRSRFARFDPRLKHLANLSAAGAGAAYLSNEDLAILDARRQGLLD